MEAGIFLEFSPPTFEIVAPSLPCWRLNLDHASKMARSSPYALCNLCLSDRLLFRHRHKSTDQYKALENEIEEQGLRFRSSCFCLTTLRRHVFHTVEDFPGVPCIVRFLIPFYIIFDFLDFHGSMWNQGSWSPTLKVKFFLTINTLSQLILKKYECGFLLINKVNPGSFFPWAQVTLNRYLIYLCHIGENRKFFRTFEISNFFIWIALLNLNLFQN